MKTVISLPGFKAIPEFKDLPSRNVQSALCSGHGEFSAQSPQEEGYSPPVRPRGTGPSPSSQPDYHLLPTIQVPRKEARDGPGQSLPHMPV